MEWRWIPGFEGYYRVNEFGDVFSVRRGLVMKPDFVRGYARFSLKVSGSVARITAHRIVALSFIGPPPFEGALVLHRDDNPINNHFSNLRWGTPADNTADAVINRKHRNSRKTHCPQGHPYEGENLRLTNKGNRLCVQCQRYYSRRGGRRRNGQPDGD